MLQAPADEREESCGKVKASGEAALPERVLPTRSLRLPGATPGTHPSRWRLRRDDASLRLVKRNQINLQLDLVPFNQLQRRMSYGTRCALATPAQGSCQRDQARSGSGTTLAMTPIIGMLIGGAAGIGVALVGIPAAICTVGFTGTGIAAGSLAAKMMSAAAIANGGGVAAGSTVAVLQSIGAAGLSLGTQIGLTSTLGPVGAAAGARLFKDSGSSPGDDPKNSDNDPKESNDDHKKSYDNDDRDDDNNDDDDNDDNEDDNDS